MFSMLDPRWADVQIGNSTVRMRVGGSLICCLAEVLRYEQPLYDPATLNRWLAQRGGYDPKSYMLVGDPLRLLGLNAVRPCDELGKISMSALYQALGKRQNVLIAVSRLQTLRTPWVWLRVLGVWKNDFFCDDFLCHDPTLPPDFQEPVRLLPRYARPNQKLEDVIVDAAVIEWITSE